MKQDPFVRIFLVVIAAFLGLIAPRPLIPEKVEAQAHPKYDFYVEPGTTTVRAPDGSTQVIGKVVVELRNGKVWGFPTLGPLPNPMDRPQLSHLYRIPCISVNMIFPQRTGEERMYSRAGQRGRRRLP